MREAARKPQLRRGQGILALCLLGMVLPTLAMAQVEDLDWAADSLLMAGRPGAVLLDTLLLVNTGASANPDTTDGPGTEDLASVRIDAGDLNSARGDVLPATLLSFQPGWIFALPNDSDSSIVLSLTVPRGLLPGHYSGEIMASIDGAPPYDILPVRLTVLPEQELSVFPNPVYGDRHDEAVFHFTSESGMTVRIDIYTMAMEKVIELRGPEAYGSEGPETLAWNLANDSGRRVASGMYIALARLSTPAGDSVAQRKLMVIR